MPSDRQDDFWTRLFLVLVTLLLFGGLTLLGVKLFHQAAASTSAR